ncbi:MAG TPA: iron transporter [Rhizomicrobium sp.]|nr:iron transporter [Rhizomicrobium sp.]
MLLSVAAVLLSVSALASTPVLAAQEFYIGEPVVKEGMQIVPNYLTGVRMDRMPAGMGMGPDSVHLEADVHATKDEAHGFPEDAWIPYLDISFILTKEGVPTYKKNGLLYPMTAKDGPHYATNVDMAGPGTYHLTYLISPPTSHGFRRHVDKASGVPDWWKPITANWTFTYPSKSK